MANKKKTEITIHSSAAEYHTFVAATGDSENSYEMRYEDENIWLTQKMMAALYDVSVAAISQHIKRIYEDGELMGSKLTMDQVAKNFYAAGFSMPEIAMVTSGNAAKLLEIYQDRGSIDPGKRADIIALTKDFIIQRVYKA